MFYQVMNLSNHEKKFYIIQFKEKKKCILTKLSSVYDWLESQVLIFFFNWNSECEMQTFRIKLIQRYTQVYQLATKQQIWGPNTPLDSSVPFWSLRKVQNQRVTAWSKHKIRQVQGSGIWWNPASIPQVVFSKCQRPKMEFISRRINSTIWFW